MKVSIILPTYNEIGNIISLIQTIKKNIPSGWDHEIVVADDNSPDGTYLKVVDTFQNDQTVVALLRMKDRGLGKAIRAGIEASSGDQILVMDTDFTHDPVEIPRLLHVGKMYDIVSGSRFCPGGNMQDKLHYHSSFVYNLLMRVILRTQVQDNLGGYFTAKRSQISRLPFDEIFVGYGDYFFRLLHFAQAAKMSIVEIPAVYHSREQGKSKSNFLKMLFTYTEAMIRIKRFNHKNKSRSLK
jgi:dolichol-phosphate mannosyltransferase